VARHSPEIQLQIMPR